MFSQVKAIALNKTAGIGSSTPLTPSAGDAVMGKKLVELGGGKKKSLFANLLVESTG